MIFKKICFSVVLLTSVEMFASMDEAETLKYLRCDAESLCSLVKWHAEGCYLTNLQNFHRIGAVSDLKKFLLKHPKVVYDLLPMVFAYRKDSLKHCNRQNLKLEFFLLKILLGYGADPNCFSRWSNSLLFQMVHTTSLMESFQKRVIDEHYKHIIKLLVKYGANPDQKETLVFHSSSMTPRQMMPDLITSIEKELKAEGEQGMPALLELFHDQRSALMVVEMANMLNSRLPFENDVESWF